VGQHGHVELHGRSPRSGVRPEAYRTFHPFCRPVPYNHVAPLYRGWSVVIAGGVIASFSWGLGFYGLGVYLHALSRRHGWSAGLISVAVTVYYALSAGCLVVVGGLIDTSAQVAIELGRDGAATEAGEGALQSKVWTRQEVLRVPTALDADGALCAGPGRAGRLPRPPDQRARALPG
jgi:hypothetical protein